MVAAPIAWGLHSAFAIFFGYPVMTVLVGWAFVAAQIVVGRAAQSGAPIRWDNVSISTWLIYAGGLASIFGLAVPALLLWAAVGRGSFRNLFPLLPLGAFAALPFFVIATAIVLPACAIGTLLFNAALRVIRWACATRWPTSPDCGGTVPRL